MTIMKILVVDGSQEERGRLADALGELTNVAVHGAAADVAGALRMLAQETPDVVVMDLRLPGGDGVFVIEAARRHQPPPAIVVYTDVDCPEARQRCIEAGADRYLLKDAGLDELTGNVLDLGFARRGRPRPRPRRGSAPRPATAAADGRSPAPVDLAALARAMLQLVAPTLPERVRVTYDIDDGALPVSGVRDDLELLLLDLLRNARDAMLDGGLLHLAVGSIGASHVLLEVADTGTLAVPTSARDIADAHGALLRISDRTGGGTRVVILFPAATGTPHPALPPPGGGIS
jgi:CheY-like chemotaxis protein